MHSLPPVEDIHADAWHWRIHYTDGTTLDEYAPDGSARGWAAVEMDRVRLVELVPQVAGLPPRYLTLPRGARPIFFRRRMVVAELCGDGYRAFDMDGNPIVPRVAAITCLGWQTTVRVGKGKNQAERNVKSFTFLLEDGTAIVADDTDAVNFGPDNVPHVMFPGSYQPA